MGGVGRGSDRRPAVRPFGRSGRRPRRPGQRRPPRPVRCGGIKDRRAARRRGGDAGSDPDAVVVVEPAPIGAVHGSGQVGRRAGEASSKVGLGHVMTAPRHALAHAVEGLPYASRPQVVQLDLERRRRRARLRSGDRRPNVPAGLHRCRRFRRPARADGGSASGCARLRSRRPDRRLPHAAGDAGFGRGLDGARLPTRRPSRHGRGQRPAPCAQGGAARCGPAAGGGARRLLRPAPRAGFATGRSRRLRRRPAARPRAHAPGGDRPVELRAAAREAAR